MELAVGATHSGAFVWSPSRSPVSSVQSPKIQLARRIVFEESAVLEGSTLSSSAAATLAGLLGAAAGFAQRRQGRTARAAVSPSVPSTDSEQPQASAEAPDSRGLTSSDSKDFGAAGKAAAERRAAAAAVADGKDPFPFKKKEAPERPPPFDAAKEVGVTEPIGYFDPLGFCPAGDRKKFRKLRTAEMKHGRVAMLASVGLVVQHYIRFPVGIFDETPNGVFALGNATGLFGLQIIIFVCLVVEFVVWPEDPNKEIGDQGDPFGATKIGFKYDLDMRNKELNNGRAAMFATVAILVAEAVTGKDGMEQLGFA